MKSNSGQHVQLGCSQHRRDGAAEISCFVKVLRELGAGAPPYRLVAAVAARCMCMSTSPMPRQVAAV